MKTISHSFLYSALLLMIAFLSSSFGTEWDTFRCGKGLVSRGDTTVEVLKKCGPPSFADKRDEMIRRRGYLSSITIEEWTYNRGPYEFMYLLRFENGRVVKIQSLETGF